MLITAPETYECALTGAQRRLLHDQTHGDSLVVIASFLLVAPVIESGTQTSTPVFQAMGNASDGAGD